MSHDLIDSVRNYLSSNHMFVDEEWLSGCVEYLTAENNTYNEREIQNLAKEQWLLNNLKDICPGSLPENIKNQQKCLLNGKFVLQINTAVDIGTPAYQQYLKLKKVNMENVEATTKFDEKVPNHSRLNLGVVFILNVMLGKNTTFYGKPRQVDAVKDPATIRVVCLVRVQENKNEINKKYRMIKLYMTDGKQEISGIEYKPLRNLSCDITPGCKVMIKGPIECRRGIVLLTEATIELLGGEVQEMAESNSLPGLLSSKLGLLMSQEAGNNIMDIEKRNPNIPTPHAQMPIMNETTGSSTLDHTSRPISRVDCTQVANFADDDIDFDQLEAIEAQITEHPAKRPMIDDNPKPEKRLKMNPIETVNMVEDYPNDADLFQDEDDYLRELEADFDAKEKEMYSSKPSGPTTLEPEPFIYIKQINELREENRLGRVFKVKGQIMKLLSKLSVGKDGWSLKCTIVDGSGSIDVDFTSEVLSQVVGYTPQEMNQMKKQMSSQPDLKEKAVSALQKAKETLQVLYCIIELTMLERPKITKLTPFEEYHVHLLKKRLKDSNL